MGETSKCITDIKVHGKDAYWVQIYVDGEPAFTLPVEEAIHLQRGQQLHPEEFARLNALAQYYQAKERAMTYLARRPRSVAEVRRYLREKGFAPEIIERVLQRLQILDYVNDRDFAAFWVEQREAFRPRGVRALRYELRQKGIDDEIIDEAVRDVDEITSARRALRTRTSRWRTLDWPVFRQKATAFLVRRGFTYDVIRDVVREAWQELHQTPPEEDVDEEVG